MKKADLIAQYGSTAKLAELLGITRHAIYQWPDDLPQATVDRVSGAAMRAGLIAPYDRDRPTADAQEPADAGSQTTSSTADAAAPTVDGEAA